MKLFSFFISSLFAITSSYAQTGCDKFPQDYKPKNLNDALDYLDCTWKDKEVFAIKSENDAVADAHFAGGQWMRNDWGLIEQKGSLYKEFKSLGITFPEDISTIILVSFHRHLNQREIDLSGQVNAYKAGKKQQQLRTAEKNKLAKTLKLGDTVQVVYSRHPSTRDKYDLALLNYGALVDQPSNCIIDGIVKSKKNSKGSYILSIEIIDTTNCDSSYYGDTAMIKGQTFSYNMTYFNLTIN
jgi:hypothetical protein